MSRLTVIGMGLIGGSIALGAMGSGRFSEVVGYDSDPAALEGAIRRGAVHRVAHSPEDAVWNSSLVVVAAPLDAFESIANSIAGSTPEGAVVTDVGSAKERVVAVGEEAFGPRFVGGHPMAGSERHGIDAADPDLFRDAWWILTPTPATSSLAYNRVTALAAALGARPVALDPPAHDELVARLSHLPQLVAGAVVEAASSTPVERPLLTLAAGGFRDVTRIAAGHPDLWLSILRGNEAAVLRALEAFQGTLTRLMQAMESGDWEEVRTFLARARAARTQLFARPDLPAEPAQVSVPAPDRPGVLAEVTTTAGELGANIEDLRIVHSTEGGHGRLDLVIAGRSEAERLAARLRAQGYRATVLQGGPEAGFSVD
jgi:prephenate dehydrogenase